MIFIFVPEKVLTLGLLFFGCLGGLDGLEGVGVVAGVEHFGGHGHGRGGEVLHLFELVAHLAGELGQLGHVGFGAAGVAGDEVGYELLVEAFFAADAVKETLEVVELLEGGLAHEVEHVVAGMLGGYFQAAADMAGDEFAGVVLGGAVGGLVLAVVEHKVVAHAGAYEALLDAGQGVDGMVEVEQARVVGVQVGAYLGVYAAGALAVFAGLVVAAVHAVHVGRGTAEVAEIALEVVHLGDLTDLAQDAFLGATGNELALVGGDGAEGAAAKAAAVDVDAVAYHLVGGNALALIFYMRYARVGQVVRGVQLLGGHGGVGRIDDGPLVAHLLYEALGVEHVGLFLDVAEVLGLRALVAKALLVAVQHDVAFGRGVTGGEIDRLGYVGGHADGAVAVGRCAGCGLVEAPGQLDDGLFAHAVDDDVGGSIAEDARAQTVLPVVVVGESAQRGFDAAQHDGRVGKELAQDAGVDDGGVLRSQVVTAVGTVGVLGAQTACGGVLVDHRVHASRRDAEEEARSAELAEVAVVAVPVGLGHDGHAVAGRLKGTTYDGRPEGGVVYIGVGREEDDVGAVPAAQLKLFLGSGQKVGELVFHLVEGRTLEGTGGHAEVGVAAVLPVDEQDDELLQSVSLHVWVVDHVETEVEQLLVLAGVRLEHGANV